MSDDITAIRDALAAGPTPGPWAVKPMTSAVHQPQLECWIPQDGNDAAYIAACHPERIARLLDALEQASKDAERYRWLRELPNADSLNVRFMGADLDGVIDAVMSDAPGA